jgi:flagella synthesis protein FlgN
MTVSLCLTSFISDLKTEKITLQAFIKILEKEENALVQGEIVNIDYLASDKSHLIEKLIQLDNNRTEYFQNQGLTLEKNCLNMWLAKQYKVYSELETLWKELLELARTAQQLTHTNNLIISARLQYNERAFAALHCAAGNVSLYGPKGQAYINFS